MSTESLTSNRLEFDDAIESIEYYLSRGWTDGLPVVPPTVQRVREFVDYAGRPPSEIVATEPTKGRVVTVEKVAINSVMAGCLPEYFPIVLAAVEAISEPQFNLHAITASTMGSAVMVVVNGPLAREVGLNSGVGVFGPGHRPNATIGRTMRLVIINATGAVSGVVDQATLGHAGKYTSCIAEAEEVSPWEPLHVERGIAADSSAVSVFAGLSPIHASNHESMEPEGILTSLSNAMYAAGPGQEEIVVVLGPEHVGYIKKAGWSKQRVKEFLFETAQRPLEEWRASGAPVTGEPGTLIPVAKDPDSINLIVAGGAAGGFSAVIPLWLRGAGSRSVTREVRGAS